MVLRFFSIYDRKALIFMPPFHALTDAAAVRAVHDAMADPQTSLHRHPDDFVLFAVGEFDDGSGVYTSEIPVRHVVDVASIAPKAASQPHDFSPKGEQ